MSFFRATGAPLQSSRPYLGKSFIFDWKSSSFGSDLVLVVPIALCLGLGLQLGHPAAGMIAASGAMTVGFGRKHSIDNSPLLPMIFASLGNAVATFIGMIAGHRNFILVAVVAFAGFLYGLSTTRQAGFGWVGQQCIVFLLVASAYPFSPRYAVARASLVLAGGVLQLLCSSILLRLLTQLRADLLAVPRLVRAEQAALRSTVLNATDSVTRWPDALPYALRLAITLGLSTELYREIHFASGFWIPVTALMVLKPGLADTASYAIARTLGTIAGAVLTSLFLFHFAPSLVALVLYTLLFAWLSYGTVNVNYALYSLVVTANIVFELSLINLPGKATAEQRAIATAIGGSLALFVRLAVIEHRKRSAVQVAKVH
jgi:hypothetical protein